MRCKDIEFTSALPNPEVNLCNTSTFQNLMMCLKERRKGDNKELIFMHEALKSLQGGISGLPIHLWQVS